MKAFGEKTRHRVELKSSMRGQGATLTTMLDLLGHSVSSVLRLRTHTEFQKHEHRTMGMGKVVLTHVKRRPGQHVNSFDCCLWLFHQKGKATGSL
jgi:hypothetical protein